MTKSHVIRETPRKSLRRIRNEETRKCLCRRLSPLGQVGGVDDTATFAVALEQRHECLHAMHHARQIDIDHPAPILQRNIVGGAGAVRTGFVGHDMSLAEGFDLSLYHALDGGTVAHIGYRASPLRVAADPGVAKASMLTFCQKKGSGAAFPI
jgi:hypothetical protein